MTTRQPTRTMRRFTGHRHLPVLALLLTISPLGLFAAGAEPIAATPPSPPAAVDQSLFDYDHAATPAVKTIAVETKDGVTVADIELVSSHAGDRPVKAYLVRPSATSDRPLAAVLWVHWLGNPATTNRSQFLDEATDLAREGVLSLLVDTMWAEPGWYRNRRFERDRADSIAQVIALRRALDVLLAQSNVDPMRCAIVAHDYGAMHSVILAGVDQRVPNFVLIAGTPSLLDWAFYAAKPESMETYLAAMRAVELKDFLAHTSHATFLHQYAEHDEYVPLPKALEFFTATAGKKQLAVYSGASHAMTEVPAIRLDRTTWLRRQLKLPTTSTAAP